MATRALVGYINDQNRLVSTYNHYDGYPDSLGVGLNRYYDEPNEAVKIASMGYISYLDSKTGEIEANNKQAAEITSLPREFDEAMRKVYSVADSYGADYVYLYDFDNMEWLDSRMYGFKKLMDTFSGTGIENQFDSYEGGDLADEESINMMEGEMDKVLSQVMFKLQDQPKHMVKAYMDSLANDIRLNGPESYADYSVEDFEEDYDNYIADKMSMEGSLKTKWQYRAGIKK